MVALPLALLAISAQGARPQAPKADIWPAPVPRVFASKGGMFGLRVIPQGDAARGVFFRLDAQGEPVTVWDRPMASNPVEVYISDYGHVATLDRWGSKGTKHALVMYGRDGKALADLTLPELFPDVNFAKNPYILVTPSSIHWTLNATVSFESGAVMRDETGFDRTESPVLRIDTLWGSKLRFDAESGKSLAQKKR